MANLTVSCNGCALDGTDKECYEKLEAVWLEKHGLDKFSAYVTYIPTGEDVGQRLVETNFYEEVLYPCEEAIGKKLRLSTLWGIDEELEYYESHGMYEERDRMLQELMDLSF